MPRVIDYNPVGAIGALSTGAGQADAARQEYASQQQRRQQEIAARAQVLAAWEGSGGGGRGPMTPSNGRPTGEVIDNSTDTRWDPANGYRSMVPGQTARVRYTDPVSGEETAVTENQHSQLQAIDSQNLEPDERRQAVLKTMGISAPDMVDYTDPATGKTYRVAASKAPAIGQADRRIGQGDARLDQGNTRLDQGQQRIDIDKDKLDATITARNAAIEDARAKTKDTVTMKAFDEISKAETGQTQDLVKTAARAEQLAGAELESAVAKRNVAETMALRARGTSAYGGYQAAYTAAEARVAAAQKAHVEATEDVALAKQSHAAALNKTITRYTQYLQDHPNTTAPTTAPATSAAAATSPAANRDGQTTTRPAGSTLRDPATGMMYQVISTAQGNVLKAINPNTPRELPR